MNKIDEFIEMCEQLKGTAETYSKEKTESKLEEMGDEIVELESLLEDIEYERRLDDE